MRNSSRRRARSGATERRRQTHRWGSQPSRERGQSTALDYTLGLSVAAVVLVGVTIAGADFAAGEREQVVRTELDVVGQQLAAELVAADRLVEAGHKTNRLVVNATMPQTVAGTGYSVSVVTGGPDQQLRLKTVDPQVTVTVSFATDTPVETTSVDGGTVTIRYDATGAGRLEVSS
jgi:hypothetical protein